MPSITPKSVTTARWAALTQAVAAGVATVVVAGATVASYVSDRAAADRGDPNGWAGLGEFLGVLAATLTLAAALLIGVPAVLLRRGRPAARIVLIVGEVVVGLAACGLLAAGGGLWSVLTVAYVAVDVTTIVALCRRSARLWAGDPMPPRPPGQPYSVAGC